MGRLPLLKTKTTLSVEKRNHLPMPFLKSVPMLSLFLSAQGGTNLDPYPAVGFGASQSGFAAAGASPISPAVVAVGEALQIEIDPHGGGYPRLAIPFASARGGENVSALFLEAFSKDAVGGSAASEPRLGVAPSVSSGDPPILVVLEEGEIPAVLGCSPLAAGMVGGQLNKGRALFIGYLLNHC